MVFLVESWHRVQIYDANAKKKSLIKLNRKRYWVNREKGCGYGNPAAENIDKPEKILTQSGTKRKIRSK